MYDPQLLLLVHKDPLFNVGGGYENLKPGNETAVRPGQLMLDPFATRHEEVANIKLAPPPAVMVHR